MIDKHWNKYSLYSWMCRIPCTNCQQYSSADKSIIS